ncbi:DUF2235 domain-containing protein [Paracoccus versutus]|uniref:Putative alpha/beta hydrolase family protein DUF2235 n=2 Tax=Paracoccaceae TaxID=31989 RepID=A0A3D9XHA3_PARVE|nr:putative alpha/beta hydrolase family protein DUF2235 [Paracoccus versutus]WGR57758.1 DUF2235 domain-containing protein [Paracoccus versutus]
MESSRPPICQVVLMDGTFASLTEGRRSSIARIHALLSGECGALPAPLGVHYAPGQQWDAWRTLPELAMGSALERHICDAYAWLAREWRPGNPLFFFGYSRGAFAARSLAGMIGRVGLLTHAHASRRNVQQAWQLYRQGRDRLVGRLDPALCHPVVPIRMIGVFDTVMALGIRLPLLWMLTEPRFRFHDAHLGAEVEHGVQALALDETRAAFQPLIWDSASAPGRIEQMWFRGCHPDVGGQLSGLEYARPLANIPLVWMMSRAEAFGLPLPQGWRGHFDCDATAPSVGSWRNWGKAFLARAPRLAGADPSEKLHPSVPHPYTGPALLAGALADAAPPRPHRRLVRARPRLPEAPARPATVPQPEIATPAGQGPDG